MDSIVADCLPDERQRLILELLKVQGKVLASELAQKFNTSEDTIRRDLRELAAAGLCKRVYGGALEVSPASGSLSERQLLNTEQKQILGVCIATMIQQNQVVFIDAGSTNMAVAHAIPEQLTITVITNAPSIAAILAERENVNLIQIGGTINKKTGSALGAQALRDISNIRPDLYVMGVCSLDAEFGLTAFDFEDAEFKRLVAMQSKEIITALTFDKLETTAPFKIISANILSSIITDIDSDSEVLKSICGPTVNIIKAKS